MHKRLFNHCTLDFSILPVGPLLVKSGKEGGTQPPPGEFQTMAGEWEYCDRPAKVYPSSETRLPKGSAAIPKHLDIAQRYFRDRDTAIVHFVALTVN